MLDMFLVIIVTTVLQLISRATAKCPSGRPDTTHFTGWMMHKGFNLDGEAYYTRMPSECLTADNELKDGHGGQCQLNYASIPDVDDDSWEPAPDILSVGFLEDWHVPNCKEYLRFTYFQTILYLGYGADKITLDMKEVSDGAIVMLYNSRYPNGTVLSGSHMTSGDGPKSILLPDFLNRENRIVIVHVDDCEHRVLKQAILLYDDREIVVASCINYSDICPWGSVPAAEGCPKGSHRADDGCCKFRKYNRYLEEAYESHAGIGTCDYVSEKDSEYSGKWIGTGRGAPDDHTPSCVTRHNSDDECMTWDLMPHCYTTMKAQDWLYSLVLPCSDEATELSHTWCHRAKYARWSNCVYAYDEGSPYYGQWYVVHHFGHHRWCYDNFGNGTCVSYPSFDTCQNAADDLYTQYASDGIDRFQQREPDDRSWNGWWNAAKYLLMQNDNKRRHLWGDEHDNTLYAPY